MRVENAEDALLTVLAALQRCARGTQHIRRLYGGPRSLLLPLDGGAAALAQYLQIVKLPQRGTLRDLLWTSPFLVCCPMGAQWQPSPAAESRLTFAAEDGRQLMLTNTTFAAGAIDHTVAGLAIGSEWRVLRFRFLAFPSVLRRTLGISQYREAKSAKGRAERTRWR